MKKQPGYFIKDDALSPELHDWLLGFALENSDRFVPSQTFGGNREADGRSSWRYDGDLGLPEERFWEAIEPCVTTILQELGMPRFTIGTEVELVAHRNGNFYTRHIDTSFGSQRDRLTGDRMVSAIYYFHAKPRRFTGGELALFPLGEADPVLIEPSDNRLVAFPSFTPHEIRPVACADDAFADARFSINCWLQRPRAG